MISKKKLKVGDLVKVISGKNKEKIDNIIKIKKSKIYLDKIFKEKKLKKGELTKKFIPFDISNVSYFLEKSKKITKIGFSEKNGKKIRKFKKIC